VNFGGACTDRHGRCQESRTAVWHSSAVSGAEGHKGAPSAPLFLGGALAKIVVKSTPHSPGTEVFRFQVTTEMPLPCGHTVERCETLVFSYKPGKLVVYCRRCIEAFTG
jgi:hypothetical protein